MLNATVDVQEQLSMTVSHALTMLPKTKMVPVYVICSGMAKTVRFTYTTSLSVMHGVMGVMVQAIMSV